MDKRLAVTLSPAAAAAEREPDWSARITSPYLIGVYLAVNAIPDAYLFLDGPPCFPLKSPSIQGNHDWRSELDNVSGHNKCVTTKLHPSTVVFNREQLFLDVLAELARYEGAGGVFLSARPMAAITSVDYGRVNDKARRHTDKYLMIIPPKSLSNNWLGGYEECQLAVAKAVDLTGARPQPGKVAIVGYLWDRGEGDHVGNVRELGHLLAGLDLDLEVVWFSGKSFAELAAVRDVSGIISLPYGRKAAEVLGQRLSVPVVETLLPFGFGSTEMFLRDVARTFGKEDRVDALLDAELRQYVPALEWVIPFVLQNTRTGFIGDPHHLVGVADILEMVGARLAFAGLASDKRHTEPQWYPPSVSEDLLVYEPTQRFLVDFVTREIRDSGLDLLIANNPGVKLGNVPIVEFGYPSYYTHVCAPRPFLGFHGAAAFVERMANAIRYHQFF